MPDVLVQVVAVAGVDARRKKGKKQRSMPAVEHFERISGRAKARSDASRRVISAASSSSLRAVSFTMAVMSSEFAKREPGNQEERSSALQQARPTTTAGLNRLTAMIPASVFWWIMTVSFSWKTAVGIRPHSHWRTNHNAISSQEATRSSGTTTCVRLARALAQPGAVCVCGTQPSKIVVRFQTRLAKRDGKE